MASSFVVDNPATGETYVEVPAIARDEAEARARRAAEAQRGVGRTPVRERVALVERFVERFLARGDEVARDITGMMGKPLAQARREVATMGDRARHMASIAEAALAPEVLRAKAGFHREIERTPLGVVLDIAPWNYPLLTAINVIAPAVLAGNAVLIKHSSRTPLCADAFERAFAEAGAPAGLVAALHADHATVEALIDGPLVAFVSLTGSTGAGRAVYRRAAERLIGCGLELGGKDPAYVAADADLPFAIENVVDGATYNAGQSCCSVERVYVHRAVYDAFLDGALAAVRAHRLGDPLDPATTMGPLAQKGAPEELARKVDAARAAGARVLHGGTPTRIAGRGRYLVPALVADANHSMEIMVEESFGPVVPVMRVDSDEEAVRLMNDSRYGLTASVWTRDRARGAALASEIEAGTVYMNRCDYLDPALPWVGLKESGIGCTLSAHGFEQLTRLKSRHFRLA